MTICLEFYKKFIITCFQSENGKKSKNKTVAAGRAGRRELGFFGVFNFYFFIPIFPFFHKDLTTISSSAELSKSGIFLRIEL